MTINSRIKQLRDELDLNTRDFGSEIGYSHSTIVQVENGRKPEDKMIVSICSVYNVSESWLRTGEGEMFNPVKADEDDIEVARRVLKAKIRALPPEAQRLILDLCLEIQQAADQPAPNPAQIQKKQK